FAARSQLRAITKTRGKERARHYTAGPVAGRQPASGGPRMPRRYRLAVSLALAIPLVAALVPAPAARVQPRKLKVHISVDMEGIAGTVTGDQLTPTGFEY